MTDETQAYIEAQKRWLRKVKPRKGDHFTVLAKAESFQAGWSGQWVEGMDEVVGRTMQFVVADKPPHEAGWGIYCHTYGQYWWLPFYVLSKV